MGKSKQVRKWLAIGLSALLILTMTPGAFAAQGEASILERMGSNPQFAIEKIDAELSNQFKDEKYVTYLVKMVEQVDTEKVASQAVALSGNKATPAALKLAKAEAVVSALRETSLRTQFSLTKFLDKMQAEGLVSEYQSFYIVNGLSVTSTKDVMEKIAAFAEVESIKPNRTHSLDIVTKTESASLQYQQVNNIEWNINHVGAPQVWEEFGLDGSGIVVANMDSGVELNHPALQRKWRGNDVADVSLSWFDPFSSSMTPIDGHGHGTHTMGTMVGSEENGTNQIGVAPGATWIAARIFDAAGNTTDEGIIAGGEWILAPKDSAGNPHPEMAPDVVNNSWGNVSAGLDEWFRPMVQAWRSAGIFPEFSAGNTRPPYNYGGPGSIVPPANYPESFATAATDINNNLASFSLRGPAPYEEYALKPDISAPGVNVRSSVPGGGYEGGWNGTSMSGPHVSATVALMLQANASLTIDAIEEILRETAIPLTDSEYPTSPNFGFGYGLLDTYAAVSAVASGLGTITGQVLIEGEDTEAPVLEHDPITFVYSGFAIPFSVSVSDNISVTAVEAFARKAGTADWISLPLQRTAGDYKAATYEGEIPASMLDEAGVEYYFEANDYGNNQVQSPTFYVEVSNGVIPGYFQDFEIDATGFTTSGTNNTWEWGIPTNGPGSAYSGEKVIATNLSGDYMSSSNSNIMMPPLDLTNESGFVFMSFMHWYNFETNYDKGSVHIASDSSDGNFVKVLEFTGESLGWKRQFIDLSEYAGQQIHVLFNLASDGSVTRPGWYIDDIGLFGPDESAPAAPTNLTASANSVGNVTLTWDSVMESDLKDYIVYRSNESGDGYESIGSTMNASFMDTVDTGTYYYLVTARDYSNNESGYSNEVAITVLAPATVYSDNFDGDDDNGWTHGGTQDVWARGVPTSGPNSAVSEPNVWATNLAGNYNSSSNTYLRSPVIDLTEVDNATLLFEQWYEIETNWDKGFVEITTDGGATWEEIGLFTHSTSGMEWASAILDLAAYVGNEVQIQFRLTSDGSVTKLGWYIDNFRIISTQSAEEDRTQSAHVEESDKGKPMDMPLQFDNMKSLNLKGDSTVIVKRVQLSGLPIAATVTVLETNRSTKTDPSTGSYSMVSSAGDYTLRAEAYGYYPSEQQVTVVEDEAVTVNFQLNPLPSGSIVGTVTDERSGAAIANATVMLNDPRVAPTITDANGEFSLTALAGDYTLIVIAEEYVSKSESITIPGNDSINIHVQLKPFIGFEGTISYDDGTVEDAVVLNVPGGFGVRMTPQYESAQVVGAQFRFYDTSWPVPGGTAMQYAIYDATGPNGTPGSMIAGPFDGTAKRDNTWTEVSFDTPVSVNGDFYLVYLQVGLNPNSPGIALDTTPPNVHRSLMLANGVWEPLPEEYGNLMMRAVVKYPVGAPEITYPANNSFTNAAEVTVTGMSQAEGATVNIFNGAELVGTGTVTNNQFSVDITLNDGANTLSAEAMVNDKLTDRSNPIVITLDQDAPVLDVTSPEDGMKTNQEFVYVTGSVDDVNLESVTVNGTTVMVNEGLFSSRHFLDPGENTFTVVATDKAGNVTQVDRTVQHFVGNVELSNIEPAEDRTLNVGDTLFVAFDSDSGLDASFRIELDLGPLNTNGIRMNETAPGHYEGSWTVPDNTKFNDALIVITASDAFGNETITIAPGKVTATGETVEQTGVNLSVIVEPDTVQVNEAFTASVQFSPLEDLYAVEFSLTYDEALLKGTVEPSAQLAAYQGENSTASMIVMEQSMPLGDGKVQSKFVLTLVGDFAGYSGDGELATYNFAGSLGGEYSIQLSDVVLLDSSGNELEIGTVSAGAVSVTSGGREDPSHFLITGVISAEAFGEEVNYNDTWYEGSDGIHRIVVEALNEEGQVVKLGTLESDGSFLFSLPAGSYSIRVVVPGHFGGAVAVVADGDKEVDFATFAAGDVNGDGVIDLRDLQQAARAFGKTSASFDYKSSAADLNRDGEVDMLDISYILDNYGLSNE